MHTQAARLLVKRAAGTAVPKSLGAADNTFHVTKPLLAATAPQQQWYQLETSGRATISQLWDAAYELHAQGASSFVEPDSETFWPLPTTRRQRGVFAGGRSDRGSVDPQSSDFPQGPSFAWHLVAQYTQLEAARAAITNPQPVRLAILDVGFDFQHNAMPEHLRLDLQRNFTGDGRRDAVDPDMGGFLDNPGHGTAPSRFWRADGCSRCGCPPLVATTWVVPIRIATSVVLLSTSAFAEAIDYLLTLQGDPHTAIDIVSMSMGGVASTAWADV